MECSLIESKQYQMTNREYINQMTDEELREYYEDYIAGLQIDSMKEE